MLRSDELSFNIKAQLYHLKGLASEKDGLKEQAIASYQQVLLYGRPNQAFYKNNLLNLLALQATDEEAIAYLKSSTPSEVKLNEPGAKVVAEISGLIKMFETFYPETKINDEYLQWKGYTVKQKKAKKSSEPAA